jgi:alkylated DNA repair dioxygenase AlkB
MVRSLGLVLAIVLVVFFFARAPRGDEQSIRVVDPSTDVRSFSEVAPQVPVPTTPAGWRPTVTDYTLDSNVLRVGWVTAKNQYAEYAATTAPSSAFLREFTDEAAQDGTVDIGGVLWRQYRKDDAISLVRDVSGSVVVLGTRRDTATLEELRVLAAALSR